MKRDKSSDTSSDIIVSGGGIAGLGAACVFGAAGFSVLCLEPNAPPARGDIRTTAILQPAQKLLEAAVAWQGIAPDACGLQTMRLIDASEGEAGAISDFHASEISDLPFGWNVVNWRLRAALMRRIKSLPSVRVAAVSVAEVTARDAHCLVRLSDGRSLETALLIGADGRDSFVRERLGIAVKRTTYGQKALVFHATHAEPHNNISTEIHNSGGPFTLVPMNAPKGGNAGKDTGKNTYHSAIVWMDYADKIDVATAMNAKDFTAALNTRACHILGGLHPARARQTYPIISQQASALTAPHVALIAEAAHVLPPIGAQGLNISFADISCLLTLAREARDSGEGLGNPAMLDEYQRQRKGAIARRMLGVDVLNRLSMSDSLPARTLRKQGLQSLMAIDSARHGLMTKILGNDK